MFNSRKVWFIALGFVVIVISLVLFFVKSGNSPTVTPPTSGLIDGPLAEPHQETMTVLVYFNNNNLDPEFSCNKVFPVERSVPKTQAVARAALEELFAGSSQSEQAEGFFTSIPTGVKIQNLVIENGIVRADFSKDLEYQVGGSCRVAAIRAQITETLKQFTTVNEVVISIDDRTEDILQP